MSVTQSLSCIGKFEHNSIFLYTFVDLGTEVYYVWCLSAETKEVDFVYQNCWATKGWIVRTDQSLVTFYCAPAQPPTPYSEP